MLIIRWYQPEIEDVETNLIWRTRQPWSVNCDLPKFTSTVWKLLGEKMRRINRRRWIHKANLPIARRQLHNRLLTTLYRNRIGFVRRWQPKSECNARSETNTIANHDTAFTRWNGRLHIIVEKRNRYLARCISVNENCIVLTCYIGDMVFSQQL